MRIAEPRRLLQAISCRPLAIQPTKAHEIVELLKARARGEPRSDEEIRTVVEARSDRSVPEPIPGVAVLPLHGLMAKRMSQIEESSGGTSLERFMADFEAAVSDRAIDVIVLQVDSPGGSVEGLPEASDRIFEARSEKRIIAIADPLMASAAYFIGSSADEVLITPSGMAGSIGTIAIHTELSQMHEELGITTTVFTEGRFKGEGNPHEPLSDSASEHIQETVRDFYDQFVAAVARNRSVTADSVRGGFGEGRTLTAERAVAAGLVDRVVAFDDLMDELRSGQERRRSGVQGRSPVRVAAGPTESGPISITFGEGGPPTAEAIAAAISKEYTIMTAKTEATGTENPTADEPDTEDATEQAETTGTPHRAEPEETTPEPQKGEERIMAETATQPQTGAQETAAAQDTDGVRKDERQRISGIMELCELHGDLVSAEDRKTWIDGTTTYEQAAKEIMRRKRESLRPSAAPAPDQALRPSERTRVEVVGDRASKEPGVRMARFIRAYAAGGGNRMESIRWAEEHGYPEIAAAMTSGSFGSGGATVPENYLADEFIELLRPRSAVRSLNPTMWPMTGGQATVPKLTGGATATYKGEAKAATKSEATTGRVNLVAKQLVALVPLSTQLIRRSSPSADTVVRDDTVAAVGQRSDLAFIRGDGTAHTPKGLLNQALAANKFNANATVNLANVTDDLGTAMLKLEESDVRMIRPGWIFAPRTKQYLFDVRDGNGNFAFRDEMRDGTLNGHPFAVTSQVPTNLGSGSDESEIYFADFADVVIGDEEELRVDVSSEATYHDGATVVSAFENDEVLLRVISEHDLGLRHDESVTVMQAVTWGA